jgi:flagellar basal body-associated protein FliL
MVLRSISEDIGGKVMAIVLAIVLGLLALAFVLYPLRQAQRLQYQREHEDIAQESVTTTVSQQVKDATAEEKASASTLLVEKEQNARSALQEVELDYQLGNIAEQDYQNLRERYMQQALVALRSRHEREQEIDAEIEEQLRKMKECYEKADT